MLDNYVPTFICTVLYLFIVWIGPKYMQNRQPISCRGILLVYNLGLTLLSLYMFYEVRSLNIDNYWTTFTVNCMLINVIEVDLYSNLSLIKMDV